MITKASDVALEEMRKWHSEGRLEKIIDYPKHLQSALETLISRVRLEERDRCYKIASAEEGRWHLYVSEQNDLYACGAANAAKSISQSIMSVHVADASND